MDEAGVNEEEIADNLKIDALVVNAWVQGRDKPLTGPAPPPLSTRRGAPNCG